MQRTHPRDGRSKNRLVDDGFWDDEGRFWMTDASYASRSDIEHLIGTVPLAVHPGYGRPLEFYRAEDGRRVWVARLRAQFLDDADPEDPGPPGHIVYQARILNRSDGTRMLWFDGQC